MTNTQILDGFWNRKRLAEAKASKAFLDGDDAARAIAIDEYNTVVAEETAWKKAEHRAAARALRVARDADEEIIID